MTSKHPGSNDISGLGKKEIKKRSWSADEEQVLLSGLKALVAGGYKSDNGFRGGYMNHLEDAMRKAFPNTDLRGKPHIESKLTAWKRTFSSLRDILARSGVGFNLNGDNKIDCDNVLWGEICRPDSSKKNWRNKSWPYLETWKLVFGKDRATGEGATEFMEMVNELMQDDKGPSQPPRAREDSPINIADSSPSQVPGDEDSVDQSAYESSRPLKNKKKRHFEESISSLVDLVGDIQKTNAAKYEVFNCAFGKQAVSNKSRPEVWSLIQKIPSLTLDEMFDVGEKLLKMPECLELFYSLSEEARPAYVDRIMKM